ncbi:MAG: hypothetical protein JJ895_11515 [Balneolaceae bacterium]|nr:hypothetical protein [Balneolaceae bacterium]
MGWDGINYKKSIITRPNPLPRNALDAALSVQVASIGTKFRYNFSVFNSEESLQSIEDIALKNLATPPSTVILPKNWEFSPNMSNGLISWSIKIPLDYFRESLIKPGESTDSLSFYSLGIPRVSSFFIQGNNGKYGISSSSVLMSNSFSGYILGPWLPDSTMSLDSFTDTLETFCFRSCEELGWANDGTVCGQLEDDLSEIKTNLQEGDSLSAANAISDFIELVEQEKDESLTSEGYALLFFNAEYLRRRLEGGDH